MATFVDRNINEFKTRLKGGGARPNLFEVSLTFPTLAQADGIANDEVPFMVKAADLPASNVGDIPVNFRGRILHGAGDRTFDPWTVTVINNTDWSLRKAFENWSNAMNDYVYDSGITNPQSYQSNGRVMQLARSTKEGTTQLTNGKIPVVAAYDFYGLWPSQVSSIALDYGSTDTIEEFQITFQVEYWKPDYSGKWETPKQGISGGQVGG